MTKKLLVLTTILLVAALAAFAADVSGKWTYEQAGFGGGDPVKVTITLKAEGTKLTGSIPGMGRPGGDPPPPSEITNGKVDGDKVYFETTRAGRQGGAPTVTKYEGSVSGDTMTLKVTRPGRGGDAAPTTTDVTAKREK
jgi:hypothetical protein